MFLIISSVAHSKSLGGNQNHNLVLLGNMKQYYSYIRRLSFLNILFETSVCDRRCFHHRPIHLSTIVIYQDHVVDSENPFDTDPLFSCCVTICYIKLFCLFIIAVATK